MRERERERNKDKTSYPGICFCHAILLSLILYRRIGLSGTLRYLAHPAYQAHALFLTKSV